MKRLSAIAVSLALLAITATACGDDADSGGEPAPTTALAATAATASTTPAVSTAPATSPAAGAFPVTIEHAFGSTTVDSEPQRVVSIGFTDHDVLLALGVEPVAIRQWYGDYEFVWPWAEAALGDLEPELLAADALNFEQIAALDPDLIVGQYVGLEADEYDSLSAIAPTIAQPADHPAFGAPWGEMTRNLGAAVGRSEAAEALVTDVEQRFADVRAAHPEWEGVELAYAGVYGTDSASYYVETNGSTRMRVLQDLGFVVPDALAALGTDSFYHDISVEQIALLETDVVLWEPAMLDLLPDVEANPLYQNLDVAAEDRDVFLTDPVVAGAMAHSTVLSLPVVLDFLVPELERAVANLEP